MRTPQRCYAQQRLMYQPALLTCPHCGELLVMGNALAWHQTVQPLDRVLSGASRPGRCPHETWAGSRMRRHAAAAQSRALPGSPDGDDGLVHLGWLRSQSRATSRERPTALAAHVRLSAAHVRSLSQQVSLPLWACHERQPQEHWAQSAQEPGGVMSALDGLAPQGGEPHLGCIRALTSGRTWRSGWLAQQDPPTCAAFLKPRTPLEWPILAVLSAKPTGVGPAVATGLPARR